MEEKIALFTAESAPVGAALNELIERYADRLELVVVSDVYRGDPLTAVRETAEAWRSGGNDFARFLLAAWVTYFGLVPLDRAWSALARRPRSRFTVRELCGRLGIECMKVADVNAPDVVADLDRRAIGFHVSLQFDQIFHEPLIATARRAVLNVHPSYLPTGRGRFPVIAANVCDDVVPGATVHQIVDRGIDSGPIITQVAIPLPAERSILYHEHILYSAGAGLVAAVIDDFERHYAGRVPQGEGSYYSYPDRADVRRALRRGIRFTRLRDLIDLTFESAATCRRRWLAAGTRGASAAPEAIPTHLGATT